MKLNRRQFLTGLLSVGATIALPVALAQATPAQVNTAWKQLLKDPWYFDVNECDTIVDSSIGEPKIRSDVFDVYCGESTAPESLICEIEGCYPLTRHFQKLAWNERDEVRSSLDDDESLSYLARKRLERLAKALDDEDEGWAGWVLLEGNKGLPKFKGEVEDWLASPIEWSEYEWFPRYATSHGSALGFFESLPYETLEALGVVIIEGEHPGSTYFAAELRQPIEDANVAAEELELPFRFRAEGSAVAVANSREGA